MIICYGKGLENHKNVKFDLCRMKKQFNIFSIALFSLFCDSTRIAKDYCYRRLGRRWIARSWRNKANVMQ